MLPSSLSAATSAISAVSLARDAMAVVGQAVGKKAEDAMGFAEVLRSADALGNTPGDNQTSSQPTSLNDLSRQFASLAERTLKFMGFDANPAATMEVQPDGQIRVLGNHPQAARIEAAVNGDQELTDLAKQISLASEGEAVVVHPSDSSGLTDNRPEMNILRQR